MSAERIPALQHEHESRSAGEAPTAATEGIRTEKVDAGRAFAPQQGGGRRFSQDAAQRVICRLQAHETDGYYLSTPYGNEGPQRACPDSSRWNCWHPNGSPTPQGEAYMNCAGFVVAVLEACGIGCQAIGHRADRFGCASGGKADVECWRRFLDSYFPPRARYESKDAMLTSGKLRKGDLILAEPRTWRDPAADGHIAFFWGDEPDEDKAWHSALHGDGVVAGLAPGNMISRISAATPDCYWLHAPLVSIAGLLLAVSAHMLRQTRGAAFTRRRCRTPPQWHATTPYASDSTANRPA